MRSSLHVLKGASLLLVLPLAAVVSCGDEFETEGRCPAEEGVTCDVDPWVCDVGQNCWIDTTGAFACLNVGAAEQDGTCTPVNGSSTCGQDQGCLQLMGEPAGTCRTYCDTQDPCKTCRTGFNCVPIGFPNGGTISFCIPG